MNGILVVYATIGDTKLMNVTRKKEIELVEKAGTGRRMLKYI